MSFGVKNTNYMRAFSKAGDPMKVKIFICSTELSHCSQWECVLVSVSIAGMKHHDRKARWEG